MIPGKYETRARIPRSAAALVCSISSRCADLSQTLRSKHAYEQTYVTLRAWSMNMHRVFPPIEQASAFLRSTANLSFLSWMADIVCESAEWEIESINNRRSIYRIYASYAHKDQPPNPAQFRLQLRSELYMHRKRIIVRSYITLSKMTNDTSFASTPLLRGCELFVRA